MSLLKIENLHATIDDKEILKGINLEMGPGEIHAIMGPNGSGKSTLSYVLAGRDGYEVTEGSVTFKGKDLLELEADERANEGIFLAFQYPVEIPGVKNIYLLKKDTSKNYGRAVENLLMVVCLETMKNFLSVGKIKKKFMV